MSEHLPAEIKIGGKVRRSIAEALCEVIAGEGVALDWGEARFRPQTVEELLAARSDDGDDVTLLRLCDDQASLGGIRRSSRDSSATMTSPISGTATENMTSTPRARPFIPTRALSSGSPITTAIPS